jgi:hypothetical protein
MKYLLPPAWAVQYQRAGRFGLLLVFIVAFYFPRLWLTPVYGVAQFALHWANPFVLPGALGAL